VTSKINSTVPVSTSPTPANTIRSVVSLVQGFVAPVARISIGTGVGRRVGW
jgi:hypothetical protein